MSDTAKVPGVGRVAPGEHYAFCKEVECSGCLPSDAALRAMPLIALWGEMAQRCIAQTPSTKTHEGALRAIFADYATYREVSEKIRAERFPSDPDEQAP